MSTLQRWQVAGVVALGVALVYIPFALGRETRLHALIIFGGGVAFLIIALWEIVRPRVRAVEYATIVVGLVLLFSPWILGGAGFPRMAWSAWLVGIIATVVTVPVLCIRRDDGPRAFRP